MSTIPEAAGEIVALLRQQLAGEPLPALHTPDADRVSQALLTFSTRASPADLVAIGGAALQLLVERWQAALMAERAQLQAKLTAMRADGAGPESLQ